MKVLAGMLSVVYTDVVNGVVMLLGVGLSVRQRSCFFSAFPCDPTIRYVRVY
jgi:hypothetical protein